MWANRYWGRHWGDRYWDNEGGANPGAPGTGSVLPLQFFTRDV